MDLKDILIQYRKEHNISQREFARRSGLSNAQISILEFGMNKQSGRKPTPDMNTYKKIAEGMGISLQTLFKKIGDSEIVNLDSRDDSYPIVIPDSERFSKIVTYMTPEDYETVMEIYTKTYNRMKAEGVIDT
jgi:transcriptional regulator with XRE-family HTH domain